MKTYRFARYLGFNRLFEHFLLAAIVTIILIRLYLHLTGYPQLGGGDLHIAHMLWGGLLMMFALLGSLLFLNNDLKNTWAVLGGVGFGTFIDEIGKFVTKDNNYFYQPTFAIIYAIFVVLYLLYRNVWYKQHFSSEEYLLNSVDELKEVITKDLDKDEIARALYYLSLSDPKSPVTKFLKRSFKEITEADQRPLGLFQRVRSQLIIYYSYLVSKKWFLHGIVLFFVMRAVLYLIEGSSLLIYFSTLPPDLLLERLTQLRGVLPFINVVALLVQAGLTIVGAVVIWQSRLLAYHLFRNALLVSILFLQVFNFYNDPSLALFTTFRDIILLVIMEYMVTREVPYQKR